MCSRPIERDGNTFACRTCNECIATRRHSWVARAMAEKTDHKHALIVALTYADNTPENREAAQMFAYCDVQAFIKRLASAARRADPTARIRFLAAGEQGDRSNRCHWHLVIYSGVDVCTLGTFKARQGEVTERKHMLSEGKRKIRLNWSLWPHGFVTLQEPNEAGMSYVLSYCLKDQFTVEKAKGTMREASAENFATGLFRMSKRPAIGESFLMRKMQALDATHSVLPSLKLSIPDFRGYWQPNGLFRKKLLWCLVALNKRAEWLTGAPAPQWAALLASCADNPADMEILNGPQQDDDDDSEAIENTLARRSREIAGFQARAEHRRTCGGALPCSECLNRLNEAELDAIGVRRASYHGYEHLETIGDGPSIEARQRSQTGHANPHCQKRGSTLSRLTFPASDGIDLSARNV